MLEVKIGDDMIFVEKKYVKIQSDEIDPVITDKKVESIEEDDDDDDDDDDFNLDLDDLKDDDDDDTFSFDMEDVEDEDDDSEEIVAQDEEPAEEPIEAPAPPAEEPDQAAKHVEPQEPMNKDNEMIVLQAKLKKSLAELEDLRNDMKNTFTSSDTLGNTITSLRGMLDALKKDQMDMLSKGQ